jgi:hypothetical protein
MERERYPKKVRELNDLLRSELGSNPRYAWRWSEHLLHVMEVVDDDGNPQYVESKSPAGLTVLTPKTAIRKLLPFHDHCWILCALVDMNPDTASTVAINRDGAIYGTGSHAWMPVSGSSGPVHLGPFEEPELATTNFIIGQIRDERSKSVDEVTGQWTDEMARKEKARWNKAYDEIRDAATAYFNVPGRKAHVSFPSVVQ